ncbi:hypothetical protein H4I95_02711 [Botrytis cinerea]
MAILRFLQDPIGIAPEFVTSTTVASQGLVQQTLTTSTSTSTRSNWLALSAITPTKASTFTPIQTLITSLLYREPSNIQLTVANPAPTNVQGEPSTNVHSHFPQFGRLAVTPYQLMSNRISRSHSAIGDSTVRPLMPQSAERIDLPATSIMPMNTFTKITIKACEEGHESIILDEIELRDFCRRTIYFTDNLEADARDRKKVSLRGGSGAEEYLLRTGAITSFKQTEERWKPTWSATKSLFGSRRRESESISTQNASHSVSNSSTISGNNHSPPPQNGDRSLGKSSKTTSKRATRQENTSGTAFSFPVSKGSDSEIPRFPTLNRIKRKLGPLIHSVSKQSLRERFSSVDHSGEYSTEKANSEETPYSSTVRKALRRARSSASIPFGLFKLPEPARNDPEPSAAGPVSIISNPNDAKSVNSDTASENTLKARSPVSTLLGVRANRRSGSGHQSRTLERMAKHSVADHIDVASSLAFSNARRIEGRCGSGSSYKSRGPKKAVVPMGNLESVARENGSGSVLKCSNSQGERSESFGPSKNASENGEEKKDDNETEDENGAQAFDPTGGDRLDSIHVVCRSNISEEEDNDDAVEIEQESSDEPFSYRNPTSVGHANKSSNSGQTAMANHFHARARRVRADSTDSSRSFMTGNKRKLRGRLGLLMIRGVTGGEDGGVGARRGGKVELVPMNLGGDY